MVNLEENMINLNDSQTQVTTGGIITITGKKHGDWHVYNKRDRKILCVTLSNMDLKPGLHDNLFIVMQELHRCFQVAPEGETLILRKRTNKIQFEEKNSNNSGKGFLLTTKYYNIAKNDAILAPEKWNSEGTEAVQPKSMEVKNK